MDCLFVDFLLEASGPLWIGPDSRQVHVVKNTEFRSLISVEINVFSVAQETGDAGANLGRGRFLCLRRQEGDCTQYRLVADLRVAQDRSY